MLRALLSELFNDVAEKVVSAGSEVAIEVIRKYTVVYWGCSWSTWLLMLLLLSLIRKLLSEQVSEEISLLHTWLLLLLLLTTTVEAFFFLFHIAPIIEIFFLSLPLQARLLPLCYLLLFPLSHSLFPFFCSLPVSDFLSLLGTIHPLDAARVKGLAHRSFFEDDFVVALIELVLTFLNR